jgi:hypothetical protein
MPWLALPFSKREQKTALSKLFSINGIPALVTIAPDGTVINKSARGAATGDREGDVPSLCTELIFAVQWLLYIH